MIKQLNELKEWDDTRLDFNLDNLETPIKDYNEIINRCQTLGISQPELDIFASSDRGDGYTNSKCKEWIDEKQDAMKIDWKLTDHSIPETIFINARHSEYESVIPRIHSQYEKFDFNIIVLIPTNNMGTGYWQKYIENYRIELNPNGHVFYYPYPKAIFFEKQGHKILGKEGKPQHSRNRYLITIWIKKIYINSFKARLQSTFGHDKYQL